MNYWQRRQQELAAQMEKDEERLKKRLASYYDSEYRKLERQIAEYYQQYGEDNVIQYRRLMESLPEADRRLLIEQMDKFAEKYPQYADLMPVRESIYRLNRLEGLQYSVRMQQLEIGAVNNEQMGEHLKKQAARNANAAAETMGYGKNFYSENSSLVQKIMGLKWCNGKDFSERIWENANKLAEYLITDISQGFVRGDSYARLTGQLKQRFGKVSRNDAYRLIYTEGTYVMNESRAAAFEQDTDEYIFRVQYDRIRSKGWRDICDDLDGKTFLWSERTAGVNFPPMHPWCHCTATPYISNRQKFLDDYEKRHGDGEIQKVANRLGAKDAKRNTGTPVYYSDEYDYSINIEGYSEEVLHQFSKYAKEVAKRGSQDGCEHMYLVNSQTGEKVYYEKGTAGEVGGQNFWEFIESHKEGVYAFIHNHNTDGSFSETDMRTLLQNSNINPMIAVRNDAVIYVAERGTRSPETSFYDDLYQEELNKLNADVRSGKISMADRSLKREEIIVNGLLRDYTKIGGLIEINGKN